MKNFITILLAAALTILVFACEDAINSEENIIKNEKLITAKDSVEVLAHPNTDFGKVTIGSSFTVEYKIINESEKHKITIYSLC